MTADDQLSVLATSPGVRELCGETRDLLDHASWDRGLRAASEDFWTAVRRWCGYASASLDGAAMPTDPLAQPDDSAMGRLSQAGLLVTAAADAQWQTFSRSPLQVWAHFHTLIASAEDRGRPRISDEPSDPLHLGSVPPADVAHARLLSIGEAIVGSAAPGVLIAAIAHAELAAIRPFQSGSYLVARATPRMVLRSAALDDRGAAALEAGFASVGRAAYVRALRCYLAGDIPGYLTFIRDSVSAGLAVTRSLHRNGGLPDAVV